MTFKPFWSVVTLFLLATTAFSQVDNAGCPRPVSGSVVPEPVDIFSSGGRLNLNLAFRNGTSPSGLTTYCYVFKSTIQSPVLRVKPGDEFVLTLTNELAPLATSSSHTHGESGASGCNGGLMTPASTNLHFHGLSIPPVCHQDEVVRTLIQPQAKFEYRFQIPAGTPPGLYWYHPHPHGYSEGQVLGGASGALIVEGIEQADPRVAGLPERVLVLRDQPVAGLSEEEDDAGPGKDVSLNFVPVLFPVYRPAEMVVRPSQREFWRVLNASADTYFDLQLRQGAIIQDIHTPQPFDLIALDGVPLRADARTHVFLPPGARAEFIMTTPPQGVIGQLVTLAYDTGPDGTATPFRVIANIRSAPDASQPVHRVPQAAESAPPSRIPDRTEAEPIRTRRLYFSETIDPKDPKQSKYFITEEGAEPKVFDMNSQQPDITVRQGAVEDWIVENRAKESHVFHIHQLHFQLLERDGAAADPVFLDTIDVPYWHGDGEPYPSVKLRMDFRDPAITGTFVYHCHILEHEDGGMMGTIRVIAPD